MENATVLLVEDNADEEILTLRALKMSNIKNTVTVVHDGVDALDFLFCRKAYTDRDPQDVPRLILLASKLPKMDGPEVLRRLRADPRTQLLPVVILSSSKEEKELIEGYKSGANSCLRIPVDFTQYLEYIRQLSLYWLILNEAPPK